MSNIIDYLEWRGDLKFSYDGFNEVDNLILSKLSYLKLDGIVNQEIEQGGTTLSHLAVQLMACKKQPSEYVNYHWNRENNSLMHSLKLFR